jgi:hypothetical protein
MHSDSGARFWVTRTFSAFVRNQEPCTEHRRAAEFAPNASEGIPQLGMTFLQNGDPERRLES